jgi:hypothetical protein
MVVYRIRNIVGWTHLLVGRDTPNRVLSLLPILLRARAVATLRDFYSETISLQ